jgi:hypothetical protein
MLFNACCCFAWFYLFASSCFAYSLNCKSFFMTTIGQPQFGHLSAKELASWPHSGHFNNDIFKSAAYWPVVLYFLSKMCHGD